MGIFDRLFVGKVIREFGVLSEHNYVIGRQRTRLLLAERGGKYKLVFRTAGWAFLGGAISYIEVPADALPQLRLWLEEAQELVASRIPPQSSSTGPGW